MKIKGTSFEKWQQALCRRGDACSIKQWRSYCEIKAPRRGWPCDGKVKQLFPKDEVLRLQDAFIYLMVLGFFGAHQFYLGNKRKAFLILGLTSISNVLILCSPFLYPHLLGFAGRYVLWVFGIGYLMALPILLYDFTTLHIQVRKKNGMNVM